MTPEEKAKAYDEALERAQKATRAGSDVAMDIVQYIFPDLTESEEEKALRIIRKRMCYDPVPISDEDRRIVENWLEREREHKWNKTTTSKEDDDDTIRKKLIDLVNWSGTPWDREDKNRFITFLEKQKEQKPINHNFTTFHRDVVYCAMCDKNLDEGLRCNLEIVYKIIKDIVDRTPVVKEQRPISFYGHYNPDDYEVVVDGNATSLKKKKQKSIKIYTGPKDILAYVNMFIKKLGHVPIDIHELSACVHYVIKHKEEDTKAKQKSLGLSEMMVHKEPYIAPVPTPMVADEQKPIDYDAELEKCKHNFLYFWDKYVTVKLKTAKWSKEDEEMLQSIIEDFRDGNISSIGQEQWLKSLPERFNLQPKQEWSEEDRLHYANILEALEYVKGCKSDYDKIEAVKSDIAWFKSLRPSWKPSTEQMKALTNFIVGDEYDAHALAHLWAELKELSSKD